MRSINEVIVGHDLTEEEYRICQKFWANVREMQGTNYFGNNRNRWLVGSAIATRRITGQELDLKSIESITGIGRSALKKVIALMVKDGLLYKMRDPEDKRRILIKPTKEYTNQSIEMYVRTIKLIRDMCFEIHL